MSIFCFGNVEIFNFIVGLSGFLKFWCGQSLCRDCRASKAALFDGFDNIEEGGIQASSSYSRSIDDHTNDKAINSLEDRVSFLKKFTGDIHGEVESHNCMLD